MQVLNLQSHSLTAVTPETKSVLVTTTLVVCTIFNEALTHADVC
jgi:hypothetical protein